MEYHRYLKEVVQALESDQEFRAKLEKANEDDIRVSLTLNIVPDSINFISDYSAITKIVHETRPT